MPRVHKIAVVAAASALAFPASVASAARPVHGKFLNGSNSNGALVETTSAHDIKTVSFYCARTRWDLLQIVDVRRDGSFSYSGQMRQYGYEGQPWGKHHVRFSGRFTSRKRVRITRNLPGRCHSATVRAKVKHT